jgi:hypothetical protein
MYVYAFHFSLVTYILVCMQVCNTREFMSGHVLRLDVC